MPLFFFHQQTRETFIEDPEGGEFPDLATARIEALRAARQLLAEAVLHGCDPVGVGFRIADADGHMLFYLPFRDALPPTLLGTARDPFL